MEYNVKIVEQVTRATEPRIKEALSWYARQPMETQIEAHRLAADLYYQHRDNHPQHRNETRFAAFVLAVIKMMTTRKMVSQKVPNHDIEKIRDVTEIIADQFLAEAKAKRRRNRKSKKRNQLLNMWSEIELLRKKGFSWRLISDFLNKKRKIKVHWTYLKKISDQMKS